ncbi:phage exclusion lipoprotein Cor [Erwinia aphidicola]|uniref:phage exclusion lipoprotein Cor n=1 Tax=Erwinia aphidicola TaxID=68334 RepID=UPI003BB210A8
MKFLCVLPILLSSLLISACSSTTPPICYNTASVGRSVVKIPVFGIRKPINTNEYLSGGAFAFQWMSRESFIETSSCDKLPYTE